MIARVFAQRTLELRMLMLALTSTPKPHDSTLMPQNSFLPMTPELKQSLFQKDLTDKVDGFG